MYSNTCGQEYSHKIRMIVPTTELHSPIGSVVVLPSGFGMGVCHSPPEASEPSVYHRHASSRWSPSRSTDAAAQASAKAHTFYYTISCSHLRPHQNTATRCHGPKFSHVLYPTLIQLSLLQQYPVCSPSACSVAALCAS